MKIIILTRITAKKITKYYLDYLLKALNKLKY